MSVSSYSQSKVGISKEIDKYALEFVKESEKRGVAIKRLIIDRVDYIVISNKLPNSLYGVTFFDKRSIFINESILKDTIKTKFTVFHELGHALTNKLHVCQLCDHIMSEKVKDFTPYSNKKHWDNTLDVFFKWLYINL